MVLTYLASIRDLCAILGADAEFALPITISVAHGAI
jgi:hypothetical protein